MQGAGMRAAAVVLRHVGEARPAVRRHDHGAPVGPAGPGVVLVVLVGSGQVHDIGAGARQGRVRGGDEDVVVVVALRIAVPEARVAGSIGDAAGHQHEAGLHRRRRRIAHGVAPLQVGDDAAAADADVHAGLAAGKRHHVELRALRITGGGPDAREDLLPGAGIAVGARAPDATGEEGRVDGVGIDGVDLDPARAARSTWSRVAGDDVGSHVRAQGRGALVHQLPRLAFVLRAVDADVGRSRRAAVGASAARIRSAAERAAAGDEDRLAITGLDLDGPDPAPEELLRAEGALPPVRAVGPALRRLRQVDADADLAAAAAG